MANGALRQRVRHTELEKKRAISLRKAGRTHREIERDLGIARSLIVQWTKGILLTEKQKQNIQKRKSEKVYTPKQRAKLSAIRRAYVVLHPYRKYSAEELLRKTRNFNKVNGRMPLKRELNMYREYKRSFGSWNAAIRKAGFTPNPELFAHKFIAKDGHKCDSFTERIIDDWLFSRGIAHKRNVKYGNTKFTSDFLIKKNILIEFFGLAKVQKGYDANIDKKRKLAKKLKLHLLEVYPSDIYPTNRLAEILSKQKPARAGFCLFSLLLRFRGSLSLVRLSFSGGGLLYWLRFLFRSLYLLVNCRSGSLYLP